MIKVEIEPVQSTVTQVNPYLQDDNTKPPWNDVKTAQRWVNIYWGTSGCKTPSPFRVVRARASHKSCCDERKASPHTIPKWPCTNIMQKECLYNLCHINKISMHRNNLQFTLGKMINYFHKSFAYLICTNYDEGIRLTRRLSQNKKGFCTHE